MEYLIVENHKTNEKFKISALKKYYVDQSLDIPADFFEFVVGNKDSEVSNLIRAGNKITFYIWDKKVLEGIIDDIDVEYSVTSNDFKITGRDYMAILLDNDALPATYYKLGLRDYLAKIFPKYGLSKYVSLNNDKFDKIVVSPGENEYSIIERLAKEKGLSVFYDVDGTLRCSYLNRGMEYDYFFSNDEKDTIKIKHANIQISNDIRNEVIVYGEDYDTNKNIKGNYKDKYIKSNKRRVITDVEIETSKDANKRAKEEFYSLNKDAFVVNIKTTTKQPIYINSIVRVRIKRIYLDCLLLVNKVTYSKDTRSGSITDITLKLIQGVKVNYNDNDIPILPILE